MSKFSNQEFLEAKKGKEFTAVDGRKYSFDYTKEGRKYTFIIIYNNNRMRMKPTEFHSMPITTILNVMDNGMAIV
jgi:hypothetical protein